MVLILLACWIANAFAENTTNATVINTFATSAAFGCKVTTVIELDNGAWITTCADLSLGMRVTVDSKGNVKKTD